jgi:hypothetical protein
MAASFCSASHTLAICCTPNHNHEGDTPESRGTNDERPQTTNKSSGPCLRYLQTTCVPALFQQKRQGLRHGRNCQKVLSHSYCNVPIIQLSFFHVFFCIRQGRPFKTLKNTRGLNDPTGRIDLIFFFKRNLPCQLLKARPRSARLVEHVFLSEYCIKTDQAMAVIWCLISPAEQAGSHRAPIQLSYTAALLGLAVGRARVAMVATDRLASADAVE